MPDWPDTLNEEVRQHLDDRYHELRAGGTPHDEARRLVMQEFEGASARDWARRRRSIAWKSAGTRRAFRGISSRTSVLRFACFERVPASRSSSC